MSSPSGTLYLNFFLKQEPDYIKARCRGVIDEDNETNGYSQFLVDANNAAPTCYYEAASQNLAGHQYMHNPDVYGYLEFAAGFCFQQTFSACRRRTPRARSNWRGGIGKASVVNASLD